MSRQYAEQGLRDRGLLGPNETLFDLVYANDKARLYEVLMLMSKAIHQAHQTLNDLETRLMDDWK